jgi:transposase-like protein
MEKRTRRKYTAEFKQQMAALYTIGKPASKIIREYELTAFTFHK